MERDFAKIDTEGMSKKELQKLYRDMVNIANARISNYGNSSGRVVKSFEKMAEELGEKLGYGRGDNYLSTRITGMGRNKIEGRVIALKEYFAYDKVTKEAKREIQSNRQNQFEGFRVLHDDINANDFNLLMDAFGSLASGELEKLGYSYLSNQFMDKIKGTDINMTEVIDEVLGPRKKKYIKPEKRKVGQRPYEWVRINKYNGTRKELRDAIIRALKKRM